MKSSDIRLPIKITPTDPVLDVSGVGVWRLVCDCNVVVLLVAGKEYRFSADGSVNGPVIALDTIDHDGR